MQPPPPQQPATTHPAESQPRPLHVLVAGGGVGGLCLAQGLAKAGIGVTVFERHATVRDGDQGYRMVVNADGERALRDCLPGALVELCERSSIAPATLMTFLTTDLEPKFAKPLPRADSGYVLNRLTLREILLAGLGDRVQFGRTLTGFDQVSGGRVRAQFADGLTMIGDLLVGADGTDSVVRSQVVPDAEFDVVGYSLRGRTVLRPDSASWLPDILVDTVSRVLGPDGASMSVATCRVRRVPGLTAVPDYLSWSISLHGNPGGLSPHWAARDLVADWHPALQRIIAEGDPAETVGMPMRMARPVERWSATNVTLLGDAVHTVPPGRGEGANVALRDAAVLRHRLIDVARRRVPLARAKAEYENEMLGYAFAAASTTRTTKPYAPRANP
ncbi:NAD(P)/FAD-dependent oxidoreductase [Allokutzneria sp. NRRL B-24872]|uniref:FAD-dependent oxidoreductase n=1 Tax=Allokutzneria sp. NRRL B-24872 TaxID=1137961 RepID=UPI000A37A7F7|nr:FAD-dependent monooxygenase [Allokutzneria sp. NRRL B-24872]